MLRYVKPFFAILLCLLLVAIPLVDNCNAVVATTTVVGVLILTLLVAMGITLVVASGTKEDFILSKGSDFMQSKGYSGAFDSWLLSGSDAEIAMRVGTLYVAKTVVTKAKEFINWLIPNAQNDTVVDFDNGNYIPVSQAIFSGTIIAGGAGYANFKVTGVFSPSANYASSISDGTNTVTFVTPSRIQTTGRYKASTGIYSSVPYDFGANGSNFIVLCLCPEPFVNRGNTCLPGIYFGQANTNVTQIEFNSFSASNLDYLLQINDLTVNTPSSDASAIIGDYNDLDDLIDTSGLGSGNTTVYNTFNITQSGQAVGKETQDLADIVNALQQALDDLQNKIDVIPVTAEVQAAENIEPPYNDFELGNLNFSALGALLTTRFPFSIPWDLMRIYNTFVTEPEAPHWELNLFADSSLSQSGIDGTISVDLGNYPIVGTISRWFCIIEFCMFLAFATKKLVWTA